MAFVLNTTIGASTANSFITIAEATTLLTGYDMLDTSVWTGLSDTQKTERVYYAGLILKNRYNWLNWPIYKYQGMPFPRGYLDEDGNTRYVGGDGSVAVIPNDIKLAQALIALNVVHRAQLALTAPTVVGGRPPIKSLRLFGSLDVTVADTPPPMADQNRLSMLLQRENWIINELLAPYHAQVWIEINSDSAPDLLDEVTA